MIRNLQLLVISAALLVSACAPGFVEDGENRPSTEIACDGIDDCEKAVRELREVNSTMDRAMNDAVSRIETCQGQNTTKCYDWSRAIKLVESEQQAWLAWRTAHCDVFAFGMEGTSAEGMLRAVCRADLAKKRTEELDKIMRPEE